MGPVRINPAPAFGRLTLIAAGQACYYGQHNAHLIAYLRHRLGLDAQGWRLRDVC